MTIKDIISELIKAGHEVSFYKRKDGSYRITQIDNKHYRGSEGNTQARQIIGVRANLSEARTRALSKIKTPKGKGSYNKRRKKSLLEETKKEIKHIQRLYRKAGTKEGMPTIRNYRYILEHKGVKEADRLLHQAYRRILGLAYVENVEWILIKLKQIQERYPSNSLKKAIKTIEKKKYEITERQLSDIYDLGTTSNLGLDVELGILTSEELGQKILAIIS